MRPRFIWLLTFLCAAGILGAMAAITHRSLQLERDNARAHSDAELQGRIRLALWRMETDAAALILAENNRPPEQFHAFQANRADVQASPLTGATPPHVRLHFEIEADGGIASPQAPAGWERTRAVQAGLSETDLNAASAQLRQLRSLLAVRPDVNWCRKVAGMQTAGVRDNSEVLKWAANAANYIKEGEPPGALMKAEKKESNVESQQVLNGNEFSRRAEVYNKQQVNNLPLSKSKKSLDLAWQAPSAKPKESAASMPSSAVSIADTRDDKSTEKREVGKKDAGAVPLQPAPGSSPQAELMLNATTVGQVTPFRPFWLGQELFLVREVVTRGQHLVQGVWLNAESLRLSLLANLSDILPRAVLEPVVALAASAVMPDPMSLVGLPWRLIPNDHPTEQVAGLTSMRLTLIAAWAAALLATVAASALMFGVTRLSERRAAFVSSVTHELRTPLTTFRLYSEMLEQGMVDETQRTHYLRTLRTEAERLTHLVDNVLAYSRVERANRHARRERLELAPWLQRVQARFEERARESQMTLKTQVGREAERLISETDATALEQILFNLIDNACKYAAGRCAEPVVTLTLERHERWAEWRITDTGPGIARRERGRLFHPFHKSADEAANSKPGVGLGLALCKRLARALGGELVLDRGHGGPGACFVLRIPACD